MQAVSGKVVSVVVPTYRRPGQLKDCLEALAKQTLPGPWEVIVVDDGSPEPADSATESLLAARGWQLLRQQNSGPSAARNRGAQQALGEFIAFTDDDCLPHPNWLEDLLQVARNRPNALVGGTTVNGLSDDFFAATSQMIVDLVYEHFNSNPNEAYFLTSNNIICSRQRFLEVGGFDRSFPRPGAEDRDFCDRWRMRQWPIVWCPEARVEHRHAQSLQQFLDLYVRYGRGAYHYQTIRRRRGSGTMWADVGFHKTLPSRVWRQLKRQESVLSGCATIMALSAWQLANATGFMMEAALNSKQHSPATRLEGSSH